MLDKFFPVFLVLGLLSPCIAIVCAIRFYARHRNRVEPARRIPVAAYAFAVIVCGAAGGFFGFAWGIGQACYGPTAGNMCGVWAFFVTGPIAFALAVVTIGLALSLIPPADSNRDTTP